MRRKLMPEAAYLFEALIDRSKMPLDDGLHAIAWAPPGARELKDFSNFVERKADELCLANELDFLDRSVRVTPVAGF
jgi:hypothetical protein